MLEPPSVRAAAQRPSTSLYNKTANPQGRSGPKTGALIPPLAANTKAGVSSGLFRIPK